MCFPGRNAQISLLAVLAKRPATIDGGGLQHRSACDACDEAGQIQNWVAAETKMSVELMEPKTEMVGE